MQRISDGTKKAQVERPAEISARIPTWNDLGEVGDGVVMAPGWHPDLGYPGIDAVNERHMEEEGRPTDPIVGAAYGAVQILAQAIEDAGTLDHDAIRDALAVIDMESVVGPVTFREDGTMPITNPLMQRQGTSIVLLWPEGSGTGEFVFPAN